MINTSYDFEAFWCKYDNYEFNETDKDVYIVPSKNTKLSPYNPFDYKDRILLDFLTIGKLITKDKIDIAKDKVLEFVKSYGLLGFMTYLPLNNNFILQNSNVYLKANNLLVDKEILKAKEYIEMFLKNDTKHIVELAVTSTNNLVVTFNELNPISFMNLGTEYAIMLSKGYSEKLSLFFEYAKELYSNFMLVESHYILNEENTEKVAKLIANRLQINNLSCGIAITKNKPTLKWTFNSLKLAIDTMLLFEMTSDKQKLKICKHCTNPFYSENIKTEYCSPQCRNQANVYKSRGKNK